MKIQTISLAVVVFSAFLISLSYELRTAEGARCAVAPFRSAYKAANSVFVGEVTADETVGDKRVVEFAVHKYWKGPNAERLSVTVYENMRFQSWFGVGERYLIYATGGADGLVVERCSRSRTVELAKDDLKNLGRGKSPRR